MLFSRWLHVQWVNWMQRKYIYCTLKKINFKFLTHTFPIFFLYNFQIWCISCVWTFLIGSGRFSLKMRRFKTLFKKDTYFFLFVFLSNNLQQKIRNRFWLTFVVFVFSLYFLKIFILLTGDIHLSFWICFFLVFKLFADSMIFPVWSGVKQTCWCVKLGLLSAGLFFMVFYGLNSPLW